MLHLSLWLWYLFLLLSKSRKQMRHFCTSVQESSRSKCMFRNYPEVLAYQTSRLIISLWQMNWVTILPRPLTIYSILQVYDIILFYELPLCCTVVVKLWPCYYIWSRFMNWKFPMLNSLSKHSSNCYQICEVMEMKLVLLAECQPGKY